MNAGMTTSKKLFDSPIGIAYRIGEKTVVRSGYGVTYDPLPFSRPLRGLYPASIGGNWVSDPYFWFNRIEEGIPSVPVPFRTMSITERLKMEVKAEALNLSNTPHFQTRARTFPT